MWKKCISLIFFLTNKDGTKNLTKIKMEIFSMKCFFLDICVGPWCHCMKNVRIWSFSGTFFPGFELNTRFTLRISVFSPNTGKTDQKNSKYEPFLRSLWVLLKFIFSLEQTVQKMKFSIKDFLIKCDQIRSFLPIWSHLLKKSLMENFIFCAVTLPNNLKLFTSW